MVDNYMIVVDAHTRGVHMIYPMEYTMITLWPLSMYVIAAGLDILMLHSVITVITLHYLINIQLIVLMQIMQKHYLHLD